MNQRGFVTTALLILLPLIICALAVIASAYFVLRDDGLLKHRCRVALLAGQAKAAQDVQALMALNPGAEALRWEREAAERAAGAPGGAIAVTAVMAKQATYQLLQQAILRRGQITSRETPLLVRSKLGAEMRGVQMFLVGDGAPSLRFIGNVDRGAFDMKKSPADSMTPDYEPAPNFEKSQEMRVSWNYEVLPTIPAWLRNWLTKEPIRMEGSCSATLEKKGNQWQPVMTKDKSRWSSPFVPSFLVAMFLIVISLSKMVLNEQKTTRFGESKGERWTKKTLIAFWAHCRRTPQTWAWVIAAMLAGFLAYYWDAHEERPQSIHEPEPVETAATFIPAGYVLVPIEVSNFESLDSILGKFGVVDLYLPSEDPKGRPKKVGEKLKILRAPLNPSRFAVLAREQDSARLVSHPGPFIAIIQNPKTGGTGLVSPDGTHAPRSRITVEVSNGKET